MEGIDYSQITRWHYGVGYKFLSVDGGLKTLENQTLRFSFASTFNDPFDCNEQMLYISDPRMFIKKYLMDDKYGENLNSDEYEMKLQEELKIFNSEPDSLERIRSSFKKAFKFSCFSKYYDRPESGLLWSHYAQKHEGVCLCFEFGYPLIFHCVEYYRSFPKFDITEMEKGEITKILFSKSKIWKYENEVRVFTFSKMNENYEDILFKKNSLKKVILGFNTGDKTIETIEKIIYKKYDPTKITFERMKLDSDTFSFKSIPFQF